MASHRSRILIVVSLSIIGTIAFFLANKRHDPKSKLSAHSNVERQASEQRASETQAWALPNAGSNEAHDYEEVVAKLEVERVALASLYQRAASTAQQADVIAQARAVVTRSVYTEIFPSWYGTAWDFYGTTEVPQQGKIACGYFVSTVLRDAGWRVERARLAQQASENIILSLTTDPNIKRFRRVAIKDFVTAVQEWGPGIYVVGLDIHTGFIVNTGGEVYFIHSSYVEPYVVVREKASESKILAASNYRVLGKITGDDLFIEKWLLRKEIATRTA
jgi:hypothetical protein